MVGLLSLAGCAVGPDFERPAAPSHGYTTPVAPPLTQHLDIRQSVPKDWWTVFHSAPLNQLIELAFKNNPSVPAAQAALHQAEQLTVAQQGFFFPNVGVDYMPTRNKLAGNMGGNSPGVQGNGQIIQTFSNPAGPVYNGPAYYNFHTAMLSVGYTPDVFGQNRRRVESLQAQQDQQRFQLEATYLTLASNVVAAALQEASLRAQLNATDDIIQASRQLRDIVQHQQQLGQASALDLAFQDSALAQAEQTRPPLTKALEQTRDLLRALVGQYPDQELSQTFHLDELHLPENLPLSLPSQLVDQRPDIRMAEEQLHYASAQVGVALSNRLPQFTLTGLIGGEASTFDQMFHSGAGFFNIIGNVSQTLFDGGTLSAQEQAAREALKQAEAQYRTTVITAFQNVADTLHAITADAQTWKSATVSAEAAHKAWLLTQRQRQVGYVSPQVELMAQINHQQTELSRIQAQVARLGDSAALYQALGGGWWTAKPATLSSGSPQ